MKIRDFIEMIEKVWMAPGSDQRRPPPLSPRGQAWYRDDSRTPWRRHENRNAEEHPQAGRLEMNKYAIVIERAKKNYSAYFRDVPGCIATTATVEETRQK